MARRMLLLGMLTCATPFAMLGAQPPGVGTAPPLSDEWAPPPPGVPPRAPTQPEPPRADQPRRASPDEPRPARPANAENAARELGERYRASTDSGERQRISEELSHVVERELRERFEERERQIEEAQARLEEMKQRLDERRQLADQIVYRRMAELLGEPDPLDWDFDRRVPVDQRRERRNDPFAGPSDDPFGGESPSFGDPFGGSDDPFAARPRPDQPQRVEEPSRPRYQRGPRDGFGPGEDPFHGGMPRPRLEPEADRAAERATIDLLERSRAEQVKRRVEDARKLAELARAEAEARNEAESRAALAERARAEAEAQARQESQTADEVRSLMERALEELTEEADEVGSALESERLDRLRKRLAEELERIRERVEPKRETPAVEE